MPFIDFPTSQRSAGQLGEGVTAGGAELTVEPREAARQRGEDLRVGVAERDGLEQASNGTVGCRSSGRESCSSCSVTPTASTMTKCVLLVASGVTACRSVSLITRTPRPFICSKKLRLFTARMNITIFQRLDVGAGGDHVHRHGDARVVAVAEGREQVLGA